MTYYTIRITPDEIYDGPKVEEILKTMSVDSIVVAKETMPRLHYHVRIHTTQCRASVYKYKQKYFPLWKTKGNEVWSTHDCARCKKHDQCSQRGLTYVCKDGNIVYSLGYTEEELDCAIAQGASLKPHKEKNRNTVAERIIKEGKWAEGVVPTGREIVDAMIRFYDKQGKYVPLNYHHTMHQLAMRLDAKYRDAYHQGMVDTWLLQRHSI